VALLRRHLSYANVVATLALVLATGGTAIAARHYLISSTGQISPKVLNKLKGRAGARGAPGPSGPQGPSGATGSEGREGKQGVQGPFPGVLPGGVTVRGSWAGGSSATGTAYESISFGFTFASAPKFNFVPGPSSVPAGCAGGTSSNPTAQPGNLCLYSNGFPLNTNGPAVTGAPNPWGTLYTVSSIAAGAFADGGSWAATSP
jgi:hypothetical protein